MVERLRIRLSGKASDMFNYSVYDTDGLELLDKEGYAPDIYGVCGGDYFDLEIDIETGKIVDWNQQSKDDILRLLHAID